MSLWTKKDVAELQAEAGGGTLRRSLGPLNLTALGIGSIIGTGIFVLTGTAASQHAGPALVLSMVIAAVACALAGLCYAELAAMIPVAGSAYTYAYASVGELAAWMIGWDLILEYALSTATVAVGWSGYFASFLRDFGLHLPAALTGAPGTAVTGADGWTWCGAFNLPGDDHRLLVPALPVVGIRSRPTPTPRSSCFKSDCARRVRPVAGAAVRAAASTSPPFIPPNAGESGLRLERQCCAAPAWCSSPTSASTR
jgi:APA family basic amino acid/polyamine antiporter